MSSLIDLAKLVGIDPSRICVVPSGGGGLTMHEFEIDPYDFLLLAEEDWERGGSAAELNAITNAKRAIVSQMDQALLSFGYPATGWNIPKKIEMLNSLGLVAPRILRRIASKRNLLEHEYRRPATSDVEDAIDLAALFVASMKPILTVFGDEFNVGNSDERLDHFNFKRELSFSLEYKSAPPAFCVWARHDGKHVGETKLDFKQPEFPHVVRLAVATDRGFRVDEALSQFCKALEFSR